MKGGNFAPDPGEDVEYADLLAAYVADMQAKGIDLYAISVQNEPDWVTDYESCKWTAGQISDFVPILRDALEEKNEGDTKIMVAEGIGWRKESFDLCMDALIENGDSVDIIAAHNYDGEPYKPQNIGNKALWQTEVSIPDCYDGSMDNALYWAVNIHKFLTVAEVNAWHYWWLKPRTDADALDDPPDNSALTDRAGNPAKRMWAIGNYSKFIRPDYYRIDSVDNGGVLVSAFKNTNDTSASKWVIVAVNTNAGDTETTFQLHGLPIKQMTPWIPIF